MENKMIFISNENNDFVAKFGNYVGNILKCRKRTRIICLNLLVLGV